MPHKKAVQLKSLTLRAAAVSMKPNERTGVPGSYLRTSSDTKAVSSLVDLMSLFRRRQQTAELGSQSSEP